MIKKVENDVRGKKKYVSFLLETYSLDESDIVTTSVAPNADKDITQDDIFS